MRLYSLFCVTFLHVPHHNKILQYQCYRPIINPLTNVLCRSIILLYMGTVWDRQGWCTTLKLPRNKVYLHEGAPLSLSSPRLPYHAIIVLSTAYQWMTGAMHCVYDIRGWLGAAGTFQFWVAEIGHKLKNTLFDWNWKVVVPKWKNTTADHRP